MKVVIQDPSSIFASRVAKLFLFCFATTYAAFCIEGDGPLFLPTLSTTWDFKPGNFISRLCIGVGCVGLYTIQYVIYNADKAANETAKSDYDPDRLLLLMALVAVFLLSVVGAVCSENVPECRGNSTIHLTAAVTFFVLYDAYMIILLINKQQKKLEKWSHLCMFAFVSVLCKLRWFPLPTTEYTQVEFLRDFPTLAIVEWVDVGCIIAFTYYYTTSVGEKFFVAFVKSSSSDNSNTLLDKGYEIKWKLDGDHMLQIALRYAFGTLLGCAVTSLIFDNVAHNRVPMISDTFVFPPGNYISRWAGIIGTTYLGLSEVCFFVCFKERLGDRWAWVLFAISFLGSTALSGVMVVSETEDRFLHLFFAKIFFGCYNVFMVLTAVAFKKSTISSGNVNGGRSTQLLLLALLSLLCKVRFLAVDMDNFTRSIAAVLEWTDACIILKFLVELPHAFRDESGPELGAFKVAILQKT